MKLHFEITGLTQFEMVEAAVNFVSLVSQEQHQQQEQQWQLPPSTEIATFDIDNATWNYKKILRGHSSIMR